MKYIQILFFGPGILLLCLSVWLPVYAGAVKPDISMRSFVPGLETIIEPLSSIEFDQMLESIILLLEPRCKDGSGVGAPLSADHEAACFLGPAYRHFAMLSKKISDATSSQIKLPRDEWFSQFDLVQAGAWKTNLFVFSPEATSAYDLAADLMLTRMTMQKALEAYRQLAVVWTGDPNNRASVYLLPKLIQSLEAQTGIGLLYSRYSSIRCSVEQMMAASGRDLCQIEKARTAQLLNVAFQQSRSEIEQGIRLLKLLPSEADTGSLRQLGALLPFSLYISKLKSTEVSAKDLWGSVGSKSSPWRGALINEFQALTKIPIQLTNQDQVRAYVFSSYLLRLQNLFVIQFQIQSVGELAPEEVQILRDSPEAQRYLKRSKQEVLKLTAWLKYFALGQEEQQQELQ